jgi:hypothetical protein
MVDRCLHGKGTGRIYPNTKRLPPDSFFYPGYRNIKISDNNDYEESDMVYEFKGIWHLILYFLYHNSEKNTVYFKTNIDNTVYTDHDYKDTKDTRTIFSKKRKPPLNLSWKEFLDFANTILKMQNKKTFHVHLPVDCMKEILKCIDHSYRDKMNTLILDDLESYYRNDPQITDNVKQDILHIQKLCKILQKYQKDSTNTFDSLRILEEKEKYNQLENLLNFGGAPLTNTEKNSFCDIVNTLKKTDKGIEFLNKMLGDIDQTNEYLLKHFPIAIIRMFLKTTTVVKDQRKILTEESKKKDDEITKLKRKIHILETRHSKKKKTNTPRDMLMKTLLHS